MWHRLFPPGLYSLLLLGCVGLLFPAVMAPVERATLGVVALPLRAHGLLAPRPVIAAESAQKVSDQLTDRLEGALERDMLLGAAPLEALGWQPWHCRVVGWQMDRSGRRVEGLVLDRSAAELAHFEPWVTYGGSLVGVLVQAPEVAGAGDPEGNAGTDQRRGEVRLLHHPKASPLAVAIESPTPGAAPLLAVASRTPLPDPWPLGLELWEDPYRGLKLDTPGLAVRTASVPGRVDPGPPPGLLVGHTQPWGYEGLSIGMFVAPEPAGRRLPAVVVWRRVGAPSAHAPSQGDPGGGDPALLRLGLGSRGGGRTVRIPGELPLAGSAGGGRRSFAFGLKGEAAPRSLGSHPGVVMGGRWWGGLRPLILGHGVATPITAGTDFLSVTLLPAASLAESGSSAPGSEGSTRDSAPGPRVWRMRRIASDGGRIWLEAAEQNAADPLPERGVVFSGVQGTQLPLGCLLGAFQRDAEGPQVLMVDLRDMQKGVPLELWLEPEPLEGGLR